jgi:type I restriction enzyme M protein
MALELTADAATQQIVATGDASLRGFFDSGLRQRVDHLMNILYSGGVNSPMDSIEQLSYLIFLRLLSERDEQASLLARDHERVFSGEWARYSWDNFVTLTGHELYETLRSAIERLQDLPRLTGTARELFRNARLKIYDPPTLRAVVQQIATLNLSPRNGQDIKGDMYEYLLSKLAQSGTNGQFRTPRHIIDLIVEMVHPEPGLRICDPACGTAGFLISAYMHILRDYTTEEDLARGLIDGSRLNRAQWDFLERDAFTGFDNDVNMVKIAILNLYLHHLERARIEHTNPLITTRGAQYPGQYYDIILANPPFAGRIQKESILAEIDLDTRDTELLFVKWCIDHLADTGRAGMIVPNGVLFGASRAARHVRQLLMTDCRLDAVITLPAGVFKPYSGVATAILLFGRGGDRGSVWFYELSADGFSLDDRRVRIAENDIPHVLAAWPARAETPRSFSVPVDEIRGRGWQLLPGAYRTILPDYAAHEPASELLGRLIEIEREAMSQAEALQRALRIGPT